MHTRWAAKRGANPAQTAFQPWWEWYRDCTHVETSKKAEVTGKAKESLGTKEFSTYQERERSELDKVAKVTPVKSASTQHFVDEEWCGFQVCSTISSWKRFPSGVHYELAEPTPVPTRSKYIYSYGLLKSDFSENVPRDSQPILQRACKCAII